ncbi:hypothetical protein VTN96DRAFT_1015 [Rasamsonia emersonii]
MAQIPPPQGPLEADEAISADSDSAYNESIDTASYASSLSSSIRNYKYENGRRYHAYHEGAYILRVLDLGTGTGIWAIEFADQYPSAQVIGTDLSPIQPPWVPPNCVFEIDDFETPWLYRADFDFIHGRELEGCIANEDQLFSRAFEYLKPGGEAVQKVLPRGNLQFPGVYVKGSQFHNNLAALAGYDTPVGPILEKYSKTHQKNFGIIGPRAKANFPRWRW